ncbi:hypothetical protein Nepgr_017906 [Nepenthes gracilis]|uniref:Uncharacterized protein n=1 Tax=Nepenthes gracilis TaxID=150966 RepID=A0AAD3XTU2_NEPGR|nr:hypothetical protein Nepgr_017906 [Nepenthes gracilis]
MPIHFCWMALLPVMRRLQPLQGTQLRIQLRILQAHLKASPLSSQQIALMLVTLGIDGARSSLQGTSWGYTLKLLAMWESEVNGANGTLVTRSVLEPWYEKTEGKQAVELAEESLLKTILLQQISTLARNTPMEPIFRLSAKSNTSILYLDLPSNMVGSCLMGWFGVVCKGDIFRRSGQLAIGLTTGYLGSPSSFNGWNQAMLNMSNKGHWVFTALGFLLSMLLCAHSLIVGVHTAKEFRLLLRRLDNNGIRCYRSEWKIGNYKCHLILVPALTVSLVWLLPRSGILEKKEFKSSNSEAKLWLGCLVAPPGVWISMHNGSTRHSYERREYEDLQHGCGWHSARVLGLFEYGVNLHYRI